MSSTQAPANPLDSSITAALASLDSQALCEPQALILLATGADLLPERLGNPKTVLLSQLDGCPASWAGATLVAGTIGALRVWILEDCGMEESSRDGSSGWESAWPCWLACRAGAKFLLHTSAGASVDPDLPSGSIAVVTDHINLSGTTPLRGLASSQLGPMFPDLSLLHDITVGTVAQKSARSSGTELQGVVAACTLGPALETKAEREFAKRSGCAITVQGLQTPLLAAAHAGLRVCALVAIVEQPGDRLDLVRLLQGAERAAPVLEDILVAMAPDLAALGDELEELL